MKTSDQLTRPNIEVYDNDNLCCHSFGTLQTFKRHCREESRRSGLIRVETIGSATVFTFGNRDRCIVEWVDKHACYAYWREVLKRTRDTFKDRWGMPL